MTTSMTHGHDTTHERSQGATMKSALVGAGVVLACAVACSLPLVLAGGFAAGVVAFAARREAAALGVILLVAFAAGTAVWLRRRRAVAAADPSACGCGGSC